MARITQLPDSALRLVAPEIRKTLGAAGVTYAEAQASAVVKSEKQLQSSLQNLLQLRGVRFVIRQRMDRKSNVKTGCPDILFAFRGVPCAWEVKMPGEKPKPEQVKAMDDMHADGWRCFVVTSYDEGVKILANLTHGCAVASE